MTAKIVRYRIKFWFKLIVLAASLMCSTSGHTASSVWFEHDHGSARLIAAGATVGSRDILRLGLQFKMEPGWKIYWRSPGDAGFPPMIDWSGSLNFADAKMEWPVPERFSVLNMETLGYKKEVVFPITATLFETGKETYLRADVRFLTCNDICIPHKAVFELLLPVGPDQNSREAAIIARWRGQLPKTEANALLSIDNVRLEGRAENQVLMAQIVGNPILKTPDLFVEGPPGFFFEQPIVTILERGDKALMRIKVGMPPKSSGLAGKSVMLLAVDGKHSVEKQFTFPSVENGENAIKEQSIDLSELLTIIGLAIIGGLILNFMPCVLPVLSIKLLSIVMHGEQETRYIRLGFAASATGILSCFVLLGTIAVGLKTFGLATGWGIQFQQPVFLAFMIAVIALFVCNMWGLYEIRLPAALAGVTTRIDVPSGLWGQFLTGIFATLLATPCTSPFLGTAVGFALSRGPLEIYAVFLALGFGLAIPWLAVAVVPTSLKWLPKPGHWMITFKRILAIALIGTGAWLLYILRSQIGLGATSMVGLLMGALIFSLFQYRHLSKRARLATWLVVAVLTAISMGVAGSISKIGGSSPYAVQDENWKKFSNEKVRDLVSQGTTVLVDVTAEWCLTCQVNKTFVLNRGEVAKVLETSKVVGLRADWTRADQSITNYLNSFQRSGIPFNVIYGPKFPQGIILPEILTETIVLTAFKQVSGNPY